MAVWKHFNQWKYEIFDLDIDPDELREFAEIASLWRQKRAGRLLPSLRDFSFEDFVGWHGKIMMCDISYDPFDYSFRLVGVDIVARIGADYTGRRYSEIVAEGVDAADDFKFYEMMCREKLIARVSGDLRWVDREHTSATFVEFPLSDDGETTTHMLTAMI